MCGLNLNANIEKPDDFYQEMIDMQRDLEEDQVHLMNAKLILILANHIGDQDVLSEAMKLAKGWPAMVFLSMPCRSPIPARYSGWQPAKTSDSRRLKGATHYYTGQPELLWQSTVLINDWLAERRIFS